MDCNNYYFVDKAKQDLDDILLYISDVLSNKVAAKSFYSALVSKLDLLCSFPNIGKDVDNKSIVENGIKKINIKSYYLYYRFEEERKTIWILRIIHQKRDIDTIIKKGSLN